MYIDKYIDRMKIIEEKLLYFLDREDNEEENYQNLIQIINEEYILNDRYNIKSILRMINNISKNHHRGLNFFEKIEKILIQLKDKIKYFYSNDEIFDIFITNKRILLFLFEEKILNFDKYVFENMIENKYQNMKYFEYFSIEFKKYEEKQKQNDKILSIDEVIDSNFDIDEFNNKRKKGENDGQLCKIIKDDLIEEFIIYINKESYPINGYVKNSIFETNTFLLKQYQTSLIEYAAFYGSSQIFKYLFKNDAKISNELWFYSIHGNDEEIFRFLEEELSFPMHLIERILVESIKCHHNEIFNYILGNLIEDEEYSFEPILYCLKYYNFTFMNAKMILYNLNFSEHLFIISCKYDYYNIVEFLLNYAIIDSFNDTIPIAANRNNHEILTLLISKLDGKIKDKMFLNCKELTRMKIPLSITSIGDRAFQQCSSLISIIIPPYVTSLGESAFSECLLLETISIPSSITSIPDNCFNGCSSLTKISIPSSVTSIGNSSFLKCTSLKEIEIPSSVKSIGDNCFSECSSLEEVTIPSSVTFIGNGAFTNCLLLKQIEISCSLNSIGYNTFKGCSSLAQITIPSSVTSIGFSAFNGCKSLAQISISSSITNIPMNTFYGCCSLKNVIIPSSVTKIGNNSFSGCSSLEKITIPSSVTSIGNDAFHGCSSLLQISIPSSITKISDWVFFRCLSLKQISIPLSVTSIGQNAFEGCSSLMEISFPHSLILIENNAFEGCTSLTELSIPSSVKSIGNEAFAKCSSIKQIEILSFAIDFGSNVFEGCSSLIQLSIPYSMKIINFGINSQVKISRI